MKKKKKYFRGLLKSFSSRRMISPPHLENKQQIYYSAWCLPRCLTLLICLGSHHDILSLSRRGMGWSQNLSLWGKSRCRTGEPSVVGTRARRWLEDHRDLMEQEQLSRKLLPAGSSLQKSSFSHHHNTGQRGARVSPVKPFRLQTTVTSVQVSGTNIFNKLHLNQSFPPVNHNKQHFGKSRYFLLW